MPKLPKNPKPLKIPKRKLANVSDGAILKELHLRYHAFVLVTEKRDGHDDETTTTVRYRGTLTTAVGLAERGRHFLLRL